MNFQNKVITIFFAILILISSTGILLIHHDCFHCEDQDWHLFSAADCDLHIHMHNENCVSSENENHYKAEHKSCDHYDDFYIKIGTFISSVDFSCPNENTFHLELSTISRFSYVFTELFYTVLYSDSSPPDIVSKLFILNKVLRT